MTKPKIIPEECVKIDDFLSNILSSLNCLRSEKYFFVCRGVNGRGEGKWNLFCDKDDWEKERSYYSFWGIQQKVKEMQEKETKKSDAESRTLLTKATEDEFKKNMDLIEEFENLMNLYMRDSENELVKYSGTWELTRKNGVHCINGFEKLIDAMEEYSK